MSNKAKIQQGLIQELASLRQRIAELEQSISESKHLEESLLKSEREIYDLYDNSPCGYHSLDKDGLIIRINDTELNWLGYSRNEVIGKMNLSVLLTSKSSEDFQENFAIFEERGWVQDLEYELIRKDGTLLPVLLSATAVADIDGNYLMSRSILYDNTNRKQLEEELKQHSDHLAELVRQRTAELQTANEQLRQEITGRKQVEEALRWSEQCFRTLFEKNLDAILWADPTTGMLTEWNRAAERLLGRRREEILDQPFSSLYPPEEQDRTMAAFRKFKDSDNQEPFVTWILRPNGEQRWVSITGTFAHVHGRPIMQGTFRDITERKQTEEKIRALNEELQDRLQELTEAKALEEEANRAKAEFLANISHELTTPLNSIIGFSQVLLTRNFGNLNEKQQRYLENILNSGEQLHDTLKNIVSFVRMDVSNPDMDWEDFRLKDIVVSALSVFRKAAEVHHLTLTPDIEKEADRMIRADRGKVIQMFHNLLSNAVKFSRDGGQITLSVRYRKGSEESGKDDFMEVTVEDTGIGIREEDLPRLFRPFEQLEAPLTKEFAGVGMGLVLARKLIEVHGGAIRVESDYGKGTKVIFTIPVKDRHEK
ncbi:MAG: PAS domain S-box protein [Deltaproteobacteria bacterium]|nr:PAS domain S-box protein [Deltaproteobacteria bacterium]